MDTPKSKTSGSSPSSSSTVKADEPKQEMPDASASPAKPAPSLNLDKLERSKSSISASSVKLASVPKLDKHRRTPSSFSASHPKSASTAQSEMSERRKSSTSASSAKATLGAQSEKPERRKSSTSASSAKAALGAQSEMPERRKPSISASSAKAALGAQLEKPERRKSSISASSTKSASTAQLEKAERRKSNVYASSVGSASVGKLVGSAPTKDEVEGKEGKPARRRATDEMDGKNTIPGDLSTTVPILSKITTSLRGSDSKSRYTKVMTAVASEARYRSRVMKFIGATAILLSVIGVALLWYILSPRPPEKRVALCLTVDCRNFGKELSSAINRAANPCVDFHSYVCGARDDPKRQESTQDRMKSAAIKLAVKEVETDRPQLSKATQFYQSCIRASEHRNENLEAFSELRSSVGLFWPEHKNENIHPLDVMVNLAVNWDMNFLFDMSTVAMRDSIALLISRGQLDNAWELSVRNQKSRENYQYYVDQHLALIGARDALKNITASDLLSLETAILDEKLGYIYDAPVQEWLSLNAIGTKASNLPTSLWLSLLAKHDEQFNWTAESIVIIEDVKILDSLQRLLMSLDNDRLIIGLSWVFIQTHLWAVYGEPSIRFPDMSDDFTRLRSHACVEYVESRLGLLGFWKTMNDRFGRTADRLHVFSFLHRVNENAKSIINALPWMDEKSKRTVFLKLDKMTRLILPGSKFFNKKQTEELYSVFPNMTGNAFMVNLLNASRVYRQLRNHDHFADVYSVRLFPRIGRESYLYLPNIMRLAFGNLDAPVFYNNATLAIRYGGLGAFAARQMVKAFDDVGVTVDEMAQTRLWLGSTASAVLSQKSHCNVSARTEFRPLRLFPVIPGLELAFHGYLSAVGRDKRILEDFKVIHLEDFTDDQIFFLVYCYTICAKRQTNIDECNVPLRNFPPFATAFHCAENTPMNPSSKCNFFS